MKSLTVRLPEPLVAQLDAESRERGVSRSDVVRERLEAGADRGRYQAIAAHGLGDLIGSVDGLPADLTARKKHHLRATGYGRKRSR